MKTYKAKWDNMVKGVTGFMALLTLAGTIYIPVSIQLENLEGLAAWLPWLGVLTLLLSFLVAYLLHPKHYEVGISKIKIVRPIGTKEIRKNDIEEISTIDKSAIGKSIRSFGIGGLFGYIGKFYTSKIGHYTAYMTDRNHAVLIKLKSGKKYLISPEKTDWINSWFDKKIL